MLMRCLTTDNLVIVLAAVQAVEIGDAVDTEQHRLAIDDERADAVLQRGFDDQRIATRCGTQSSSLR